MKTLREMIMYDLHDSNFTPTQKEIIINYIEGNYVHRQKISSTMKECFDKVLERA